MLKISYLGAKDCVTGSCHLVETRPGAPDGVNILVDCGIAAGDDQVLPFARSPVPSDNIDYLFLTHTHIDHTGRVLDLIDAGFRGEIISTHGTKALLLPMLRDAAMAFSAKTDKDVQRLETHIDELSWGFATYETLTLKQEITFNLSNAGHILGSCFILSTFRGHQGSNDRVIFSDDLGCTDNSILPASDPLDSCNHLLILQSDLWQSQLSKQERPGRGFAASAEEGPGR